MEAKDVILYSEVLVIKWSYPDPETCVYGHIGEKETIEGVVASENSLNFEGD